MKHAVETSPEVEAAELNALTNEAKNLANEGQMYGRHYGSAYDPDLTTKEIAAEVRKILNRLSKAKRSPLYGAKVSVRYEGFSGGTAVEVRLGLPYQVENPDYDFQSPDPAKREFLTPKASAAKAEARRIQQSFNHDGSEMMVDYFDVKFYGQVDVYELVPEPEKKNVELSMTAFKKLVAQPGTVFVTEKFEGNEDRIGQRLTYVSGKTVLKLRQENGRAYHFEFPKMSQVVELTPSAIEYVNKFGTIRHRIEQEEV